jgi:hypothetical protein
MTTSIRPISFQAYHIAGAGKQQATSPASVKFSGLQDYAAGATGALEKVSTYLAPYANAISDRLSFLSGETGGKIIFGALSVAAAALAGYCIKELRTQKKFEEAKAKGEPVPPTPEHLKGSVWDRNTLIES